MDDDIELTDVCKDGPMTHNRANQRHGKQEQQQHSHLRRSRGLWRRPTRWQTWPAVRQHGNAHELSPRGHDLTQDLYKKEERNMGFSPQTKDEDRDGPKMVSVSTSGQRVPTRVRHRCMSDQKRKETKTKCMHGVVTMSWTSATSCRRRRNSRIVGRSRRGELGLRVVNAACSRRAVVAGRWEGNSEGPMGFIGSPKSQETRFGTWFGSVLRDEIGGADARTLTGSETEREGKGTCRLWSLLWLSHKHRNKAGGAQKQGYVLSQHAQHANRSIERERHIHFPLIISKTEFSK
jgi:hypothetical protein